MALKRSHAIVGVVGLGVGALLSAAPFAVRETIDRFGDPYSRTDPGSVTSSCEQAKWSAVVALAPGSIVTVTVLIDDPQQRDWQVRWLGYGQVVKARYDDAGFVHAFAALGDLDNGGKRRVQVRPAKATAWCEAEASLR